MRLAQRELGRRGVKAAVRALFESVGGKVYNLSEGRPKWKRPPGLPDLWIVLLRSRRAVWFETKARQGKPSDEQVAFRWECECCGVDHIVGGENEAKTYLQKIGLLAEGA